MSASFGTVTEASSTFYATLMAIQICSETHLYGVDTRSGKFHYYDESDQGDEERIHEGLEYLMYLVMQVCARMIGMRPRPRHMSFHRRVSLLFRHLHFILRRSALCRQTDTLQAFTMARVHRSRQRWSPGRGLFCSAPCVRASSTATAAGKA